MSRVFVIADLHFGHRLVAGKRGFAGPDEHDAALCEAWRKVVGKRDVVYVLGDVFDPSFLRILPGTKKLAMGNHDRYPVERYTPYFSKIGACFEFDGCLLTHIPVHPGQFGRYELNVHGHTHAHFVDDERYVSVSVEHCTRMEPLPLRELIQARRERLRDGPPECVLFTREVKKRLGLKGKWERSPAPGDDSRIFVVSVPAVEVLAIDAQLFDLAHDLFPDGYAFLISVRDGERCDGCGAKIDPGVCWCGSTSAEHGPHENHGFVPMGCECYRDKGGS